MAKVVCCLRRLVSDKNELWANEGIQIRPVNEWRICLKYVVNHDGGNWGANMPIGYLIPLEDDDG